MRYMIFDRWGNPLGAVVSQLSDRGSKAFVDHRHRKPSR